MNNRGLIWHFGRLRDLSKVGELKPVLSEVEVNHLKPITCNLKT